MNKSSINGASKPASPFKTIVISAGVALLFGIGGWIFGIFQGRAAISEQYEKHQQMISQMHSEIQKSRGDLIAATNNGYLMQARAALYRSAIDLDKRNFGTANAHLKEAADSLSKIESDNANLQVAKIANLSDAIAKNNINVAIDLEKQRAQVLSFATQLNELIP